MEGFYPREAAHQTALDSALCRAGADGESVERLDKKGFQIPGEEIQEYRRLRSQVLMFQSTPITQQSPLDEQGVESFLLKGYL